MFETKIGNMNLIVVSANTIKKEKNEKILRQIETRNNIGTIFIEYDPVISSLELLKSIRINYPDLPIFIFEDPVKNKLYNDNRVGYFNEAKKYEISGEISKSYVYDLIDSNNLLPFQEMYEYRNFNYDKKNPFKKIITDNIDMKEIFNYIKKIAVVNLPVLICGETGTGKDLLAESIHLASGFKGEYVPVNIAGLDSNSFFDTLFGHIRGSYTGADAARNGLIRSAENGSIFLDEIGDLDNESQIKLLRLIDTHEFYPLGSDKIQRTNARIIAATNKNLESLVAEGKFRQDLLFRLRSHKIIIPPLINRIDDLPLLVKAFVATASEYIRIKPPEIPSSLFDIIKKYNFPGNIRELKSIIYDAVIRNEGPYLSLNYFKNYLYDQRNYNYERNGCIGNISDTAEKIADLDVIPTLKMFSESLISEALIRSDNNQSEAARLLGITPSALNKRLKRKSKEVK